MKNVTRPKERANGKLGRQLSVAKVRPHGSVRGAASNRCHYRECAEHVRQLEGESPFHNLMEVK
jgi:hypothetical protein